MLPYMKSKLWIMVVFVTLTSGLSQNTQFEHFISVSGPRLVDGNQEFRFISWNIPNLNFVEDEMGFSFEHAYGLPTAYEIRDALESVKQMGGRPQYAAFRGKSEEEFWTDSQLIEDFKKQFIMF